MLLMCRQRSRYMIEWMMQVMSNFYGYAKEIMKFTRKKVVLSCHSRQARFRSINRFVRVIGESMHVEIIYIKLEMLLCILIPSGACDWPGETTTVERDRFPSDFETRKYQHPNHDIFTFWQNAVVLLQRSSLEMWWMSCLNNREKRGEIHGLIVLFCCRDSNEKMSPAVQWKHANSWYFRFS